MDIELILDLLKEPSLQSHMTVFMTRVSHEYNSPQSDAVSSPTAVQALRAFVDEYKFTDSEGSKKLPLAKRLMLATALKALHSQLETKK